jgi:hypothetical protein
MGPNLKCWESISQQRAQNATASDDNVRYRKNASRTKGPPIDVVFPIHTKDYADLVTLNLWDDIY